MAFHDTEMRFHHPELFRNEDIEREVAGRRRVMRPGFGPVLHALSKGLVAVQKLSRA